MPITPPPDLNAWLDNLMHTLFAAFVGFMAHVFRTLESKKKVKIALSIVHGICSGIVGFMVGQLCKYYGAQPELTWLIVGLAGWVGPEITIHLLETSVRSKLGFPKRNDSDASS